MLSITLETLTYTLSKLKSNCSAILAEMDLEIEESAFLKMM